MSPAALRQLAALVEARKARDLARLDALMAEDRRLAAEIAALAATGVRDLAAAGPALPPARQGLRLTWADQRIAAARRRRTELVGAVRAARAAAVQSLGKHRALEELVERADRDAAARLAARAEREAPPWSRAGSGSG